MSPSIIGLQPQSQITQHPSFNHGLKLKYDGICGTVFVIYLSKLNTNMQP